MCNLEKACHGDNYCFLCETQGDTLSLTAADFLVHNGRQNRVDEKMKSVRTGRSPLVSLGLSINSEMTIWRSNQSPVLDVALHEFPFKEGHLILDWVTSIAIHGICDEILLLSCGSCGECGGGADFAGVVFPGFCFSR